MYKLIKLKKEVGGAAQAVKHLLASVRTLILTPVLPTTTTPSGKITTPTCPV
jgi:hypothetical protein